MTAGRPGGPAAGLGIGVVLEAFGDWPLERVLSWLHEAAPEVNHLETAWAAMRRTRTAMSRPCSPADRPGAVRLHRGGERQPWHAHPSVPYAAQWWPIGQGVGYGASFGNQVADLLEGWPDAPWTPGFGEGAAVQAVCDAMETSAASGRWVMINEVTGGGNL